MSGYFANTFYRRTHWLNDRDQVPAHCSECLCVWCVFRLPFDGKHTHGADRLPKHFAICLHTPCTIHFRSSTAQNTQTQNVSALYLHWQLYALCARFSVWCHQTGWALTSVVYTLSRNAARLNPSFMAGVSSPAHKNGTANKIVFASVSTTNNNDDCHVTSQRLQTERTLDDRHSVHRSLDLWPGTICITIFLLGSGT